MEYGRLEPIKGVSAQEPTAFTKKTIKELLAEEAAALEAKAAEAEAQKTKAATELAEKAKAARVRADEAAARPAPEAQMPPQPEPETAGPRVQQPPHMRAAFDPLPPQEVTKIQELPGGKARSLLGRIFGK